MGDQSPAETADEVAVLLVAGDADFRATCATRLERRDERFDVDEAAGADPALARLRAEPVSCVVSEYDLPTTNGLAMFEAVQRSYPGLPVVLCLPADASIAGRARSLGLSACVRTGTDEIQCGAVASAIRRAVGIDETV